MLAYAADRSRIAERRLSPQTLLLIAGAHIAVIAAVMSARMDLPQRIFEPPIILTPIPIPKPPPPNAAERETQTETKSTIDQPPTIVHLRPPTNDGPDTIPNPPTSGGERSVCRPRRPPQSSIPPHRLVSRRRRHSSPALPAVELDREEEAVLRLKLTIDAGGRVTAVDPVGQADPAFLAAARRHLMTHWRYRPATEDGRAIASATVITLRFQLDE